MDQGEAETGGHATRGSRAARRRAVQRPRLSRASEAALGVVPAQAGRVATEPDSFLDPPSVRATQQLTVARMRSFYSKKSGAAGGTRNRVGGSAAVGEAGRR